MEADRRFRKVAGWSALVALPLAYFSLVGFMVSLNFNFEAFLDASIAVRELAGQGDMLRWGFLADLLGYYLLLVPLALVLWNWLKPKNPSLVGLFTMAGLGYMFFGAMGAGIFASALSSVVDTYAQVAGTERQVQEALYITFSQAVQMGIWGTLNALLSGVWWVGIGSFLRSQRRFLGWITIVLGIIMLLTWLGVVTGLDAVAQPATAVSLYLAPIWAAWTGVVLLRMPATSAT